MDGMEKQPIPWQKRKELGLAKAFWQTAKQVLSKPGDFFNNLEIKYSYSEPFYFWIINVIFIVIVMIIYNILFAKGGGVGTLFIFLVLSPLLIFSVAGIMHLWILLFRGKGGFKGTFNLLAYSSITGIFNIIPFIGGLVAGVWGTIVWVIGFKRIHKFGTPRAILMCFFNPFALLIIALLAAIAIPNLLRARLTANELTAQATVKMISTAIENYATANNGQYPSEEYFRYTKPYYLDKILDNKTTQGYIYSLNLKSSGYEITATPSKCGSTGTKIFTIETEGRSSEKSCK